MHSKGLPRYCTWNAFGVCMAFYCKLTLNERITLLNTNAKHEGRIRWCQSHDNWIGWMSRVSKSQPYYIFNLFSFFANNLLFIFSSFCLCSSCSSVLSSSAAEGDFATGNLSPQCMYMVHVSSTWSYNIYLHRSIFLNFLCTCRHLSQPRSRSLTRLQIPSGSHRDAASIPVHIVKR